MYTSWWKTTFKTSLPTNQWARAPWSLWQSCYCCSVDNHGWMKNTTAFLAIKLFLLNYSTIWWNNRIFFLCSRTLYSSPHRFNRSGSAQLSAGYYTFFLTAQLWSSLCGSDCLWSMIEQRWCSGPVRTQEARRGSQARWRRCACNRFKRMISRYSRRPVSHSIEMCV